jgi:Raf kinase inhibitor-like YbhB/YbcL family protein
MTSCKETIPTEEAQPAKEALEEEVPEEVPEEVIEEIPEEAKEEEVVEAEEELGGVMKIESPSFKNNEMIPSKYTCDAENINPPITISGISQDAKSLVLIVDDPDAPAKTWVHWTVWNIDPKTTEILENSVPQDAVEGVTDFGTPGYGGPCPPSGTHRYFFKLYALDTTLDLSSSATVEDIQEAMEGHILDSVELIGLYECK